MDEVDKKLVTVGKNGQISIGKQYAGRVLEIRFFEDGRALLSPGHFVADHLSTFYTPEAAERLREFADWEKENPPDEASTATLRAERKAHAPRKKAGA